MHYTQFGNVGKTEIPGTSVGTNNPFCIVRPQCRGERKGMQIWVTSSLLEGGGSVKGYMGLRRDEREGRHTDGCRGAPLLPASRLA